MAEIPVEELRNVGAASAPATPLPSANARSQFASYVAPAKTTTSSESTASTVSSFIETPRKRWKKSADTSASSGSESNSTNGNFLLNILSNRDFYIPVLSMLTLNLIEKNSLEHSSFSMDAESGTNDNQLGVPGFSKVPVELVPPHRSVSVTLTRTASAPCEPEPSHSQVLRKCSSLDEKAESGSVFPGNNGVRIFCFVTSYIFKSVVRDAN